MYSSDIKAGEEIIITRIGADSWANRIKTVVFPTKQLGAAIVSGSLTKFLSAGELTCVIAEFYHPESYMDAYYHEHFPIFDLGFDPQNNYDNSRGNLNLQYYSSTHKNVSIDCDDFFLAINARAHLMRMFAQSMICGLKVNKTHPDCLQGSAELPGSIMKAAGIEQYKSVTVYNATAGGGAETYAVPMSDGVVMTTGAMASFARLGEKVNVVSYVIATNAPQCNMIFTDGVNIVK